MTRSLLFTCLMTLWWSGYSLLAQSRLDYPNVLNLGLQVDSLYHIDKTFFADQGAWFAYGLPKAKADYGGFTGPLLMKMHGQWLSPNIAQLQLHKNQKLIDLTQSTPQLTAYPGLLQQQYRIDSLLITQSLIFVDGKSSYILTQLTNTSPQQVTLNLSWKGKLLPSKTELSKTANGLNVEFEADEKRFLIDYAFEHQLHFTTAGYTTTIPAFTLQPRATRSFLQVHRYDPYGQVHSQPVTEDFETALADNSKRWNTYLKRYFSAAPTMDTTAQRLAVKSIETLITNWRRAAGDLLYDGIFPSTSYQGFYGFWSWDSWKIAVGLAYFAPELAESTIWSMFAYQAEDGMVPDCVYAEKDENNWRDTKPPLAAWAAWKIYEETENSLFLEKMYPKLVSYHHWWYAERDHDQNGLCEYGSTDGTRVAAAWESGMDNAIRFDGGVMLKNGAHAWSLNQESVDLNAYLYKEKIYLQKMAKVLKHAIAAKTWQNEAMALKKLINNNFYDQESGFYFDRDLKTHRFHKSMGPEGWTPLWAGIASPKRAHQVMEKMVNPKYFNTYLPLPTAAASNPKFDPNGYWRGLVWLDQVYFGLQGLRNYDFSHQAQQLQTKFFAHAKGLLTDQPIHENYNPLTGEGRNAPNFSWSAAHILMILHTHPQLN